MADLSNLIVGTGDYPQTPWSYLVTSHTAEALPYSGIAFVAVPNYDLGDNDSLPNFSFEVLGMGIVPGTDDANPKDIITQMVCNSRFGLNLPTSIIDLSDYGNYCLASDLLLSAAFNQQKAAYEHISDICDHTNSEVVWHDGSQLIIVPYGDTATTANGITWNPSLTPLYYLTDDDFLGDKTEDPIKVTRTSPADAFNLVRGEFLNRGNAYNVQPVEAKDQANIDAYGLRPSDQKKLHYAARQSVAQNIVQLLLQRACYIRNQYEFTLGWKYQLLEPMDIVALTDTLLGLNQLPVRIVKIEENEDGDFSITAEDLPSGVGAHATYTSQSGSGYQINSNVDPGSVNAPIIFNAPAVLTATGHEIWAAVSGDSENWGGCDVWVSMDGTSYQRIARQYGRSRFGVLTAPLPSGVDPDVTNTCAVNLTPSKGAMLSGSATDCDNLATLCLVDNELISYQDATFNSTYHYTLGTRLRRGAYGTSIQSHATSANFVRLDTNLFKYPFGTSLLGKTIYLKFTSFNIYNQKMQDLADVTAYAYTVSGSATAPPDVTGFTAVQSGSNLVSSWNQVTWPTLSNYEIRYNAKGTYTWAGATYFAAPSASPNSTVASLIPSGDYSFLICAKDTGGNYSANPATCDVTIGNAFSPLQLANIWAWFDASIVAGNDGDSIGTFSDGSSNHYDLTAAGAARPILKTNIQNSLKVLRFDGTNSYMATAALTLNQPLTIFMVFIMRAHNNQNYLCDGKEASSNGCAIWEHDANGVLAISSDSTHTVVGTGGNCAIGTAYLVEAVFNGATSKIRYVASEAGGNAGTNAPAGFTLGSYKGGTYKTQIDVCEVVIYSDSKSDSDRLLVRNYLQAKWNCTI